MLTKAEWEAKGRELFGDDQDKWTFVCPSCGHEASVETVRAKYAEHLPGLRERGYRIEAECIGRYIHGVGCNWAAYGLFGGPLVVDCGDGLTVRAFDFAGKPFTDGQKPTRLHEALGARAADDAEDAL